MLIVGAGTPGLGTIKKRRFPSSPTSSAERRTGAAAVAALTLAVGAPAATQAGKLTATVGPGFTITTSVKTVKHGTYVITVRDRSNIHNVHLIGPGVNKKTSVAAVKTYSWTVALKRGTYRFICDPHATIMKGVLKVT